jgi:hypothetical protein
MADLRPHRDVALCPGQLVTMDHPGGEAERCPLRTSCRRFLRPPADHRQLYVLPDTLGDACPLYDPHCP